MFILKSRHAQHKVMVTVLFKFNNITRIPKFNNVISIPIPECDKI